MSGYDEIERAIGDIDINADDDPSRYEGVNELTGTNMIAILQRRIELLTNENMQLSKRLDSIEAMTRAMYAEFMKTSERSRIDFPTENTLREKYAKPITSLESTPSTKNDSSSFVDIETGRGATEYESSSMTRPSRRFSKTSVSGSTSGRSPSPSPRHAPVVNPFSIYTAASGTSGSLFRSNSAVAPQGYVHKASVWGTALASMLTGAMRYYMTRRNAHMLVVDEARMAKIYTDLASILYETMMNKELPPVSSALTRRLSMSMARTSKTDVPISEADTWAKMEATQEGRDIMAILKVMIVSAKMVPEAMVHPVSQLIPYILMPPVQMRGDEAVFAIDPQVSVDPTPSVWESWCSILKREALIKYVKYRISQMTPIETITRMSSEMKRHELTEKKNWDKLVRLSPTTALDVTSAPS